jgi:HAMP domain-containing protein
MDIADTDSFNKKIDNSLVQSKSHFRFVSLRFKILVGFTLLFSSVFAGAYYWFYTFSTEKVMRQIRADLANTAEATAENIDPSLIEGLLIDGEVNDEGFTDDPRYIEVMDWFERVNEVEPRAWPYIFSFTTEPGQRVRVQKESEEGSPIIELSNPVDQYASQGIVDLWARFDPNKSYLFLEEEASGLLPGDASLDAMLQNTLTERDIYTDDWGSWISAYFPLRNEDGNLYEITSPEATDSGSLWLTLGVDFQASYVLEVQQEVRDRMLAAFGITYALLFALVYTLSNVLLTPLNRLSSTADNLGSGGYNSDSLANDEKELAHLGKSLIADEITLLAQKIRWMAVQVYKREETLKQQVAELKIEINEFKRKKEVEEIVETDFFKDLQQKANVLRGSFHNQLEGNVQSPPEENPQQADQNIAEESDDLRGFHE